MSEKGPPGYIDSSGHGQPPPGYEQIRPPPGYGQPVVYGGAPSYPASSSTNVVLTQPGAFGRVVSLKEMPVQTTCPACQADVVTSTSYQNGTFTWLICLVLAVMGLWMGCCLIPFCVNACKDVIHSCPRCRHTIGKYDRMHTS